MAHEVPVFCGKDCGGSACPLLATVEHGKVTRLRDNPAGGPWMKPCPRGYLLHRAHYAPDRLRTPLIAEGPRGSGRFRFATWDEALDLVASKLQGIRGHHGGASILALGSAGSVGALHNTENLLARFLNAARPLPRQADSDASPDCGSATFLRGSYSNGAASFVLPYLYGDAASCSGWDAATVCHSRLLVLWGANVLEARLGTELGLRVAEAARAGVPVVVIDPRRSATAKALGARWIPLRPGTDAAMMLAVLHVLYAEGLVDRARTETLSVGMEELAALVLGHSDGLERSPLWAEGICGVPASDIVEFARAYAAAKPAMLLPGYSIQRVRSGEEVFRLAAALQLATGNFGVKGGSTASMNNLLQRPALATLPCLERGDEPSLPVLRWPDAILQGRTGGYPSNPKAAYVTGSNFVNQGADVHKNVRAMLALEFSVCHELYMTPTARLCDVVLPAASPLEKADACVPWDGSYALYKTKALGAEGQARSDFDIFAELADRLGFGARFHEGLPADAWLERLLLAVDLPDLPAFKATGLCLFPKPERVGLADFTSDPAGHPLPTPSGRVEIRSLRYAADTGRPALPAWAPPPPDPEHPFLLISPKTRRRTHSQNGGGAPWTGRAVLPGAPRPDLGELSLHPGDAAALRITAGSLVLVSNTQGRLLARAALTEDIMLGVVCLHEGAWFEPDDSGLDRGGSVNLLTSTEGSGPAIAAVMHGVPVRLRAYPGEESA